jgi:hypothetical protein
MRKLILAWIAGIFDRCTKQCQETLISILSPEAAKVAGKEFFNLAIDDKATYTESTQTSHLTL